MNGSLRRRSIIASSAGVGQPFDANSLPQIEAPEPQPPLPECDRQLGLYMRAHNEIEKGMLFAFERLLDANLTAAMIVFHSSASAATIREVMIALGRNRLSTREFEKLQKLLLRVKTQATIRNRIVHGTWMMNVKVHRRNDGTEAKRTNTWLRWYQPSDPEILSKMHGPPRNAKLRADYEFSVQRIEQLAEEAHSLGRELQAFADLMTIQPYQSQQPIRSPSQSV